jgi:hypothetical protein
VFSTNRVVLEDGAAPIAADVGGAYVSDVSQPAGLPHSLREFQDVTRSSDIDKTSAFKRKMELCGGRCMNNMSDVGCEFSRCPIRDTAIFLGNVTDHHLYPFSCVRQIEMWNENRYHPLKPGMRSHFILIANEQNELSIDRARQEVRDKVCANSSCGSGDKDSV